MTETKAEKRAKKNLRQETKPRHHRAGQLERIAMMPEDEFIEMKKISREDDDVERRYLRDHPEHLVQPRRRIGLPKKKMVFTVPRLPWMEEERDGK